MALIVDFVNVVGNLVIGTGDDYFIASNVVRQGSVRTSGLNTSLIIDGTILNNVGTAVFADHNTTSANNGNSIVIGETGRVISVGTNSNSLAVAVFGVGSSFTNHGQVTSIASGVAMWDDPVIGLNTGLIEATGGGVTTHYGVLLGAGSIFTNTGTIAQLGDGAGVIGRDGTATLNNTGVISGAFSYNGEFFSLDSVDIINNSGQMIGDVNLGNLDDTYDGRGGTVIGEILGGSGDDTLFGGAGEEIIRGGADNDTIRGGGARDELYGEDGNDLILGQDGKDLLDGGAGEDELRGGDGEDSLIGGAGEDTLLGGFGDDRLDGGDDNDLLRGNKGEDLAFGGLGDDKIRGDDGNDELYGNAGNDFLTGDRGDDLIEGGRGNDRIDGGVGIDTAVFAGDQANYTIQLLNNGDIRVTDNVGNDGVDRISTVEFFEFNDGVVAVADLFVI